MYNPRVESLRNAIVRYLARRGVAQRAIARIMRIDRGTVQSVLRGKSGHGFGAVVVVRRCPRCGGLTTWPCRLCRMKDLRKDLRNENR